MFHSQDHKNSKEERMRAIIEIDVGGEEEVFIKALEPEIKTPASSRYEAKIEGRKGKLILSLEASDISALRASVGAYMRWISAISECLSVIKEE